MPRGLFFTVKLQRAGARVEEHFCSPAGAVIKQWRYPKGLSVLLNYAASMISSPGFHLKSKLQV